MAQRSRIEWTELTWNPVAGCSVISPGCTNCYAMRLAGRLEAMGVDKYAGTTRRTGGRHRWNGRIVLDYAALQNPYGWKRSRLVFVNSMSDLFHEDVPIPFIRNVFDVIQKTPQHTYQVLTKRAERLAELDSILEWPDNLWMGVSVENTGFLHRVDILRRCNARTKFLSLEPLLGPLAELKLDAIDWVIVGGESGPGARDVSAEWIRPIRDLCVRSGVAFHFKQWGGRNKKAAGRILDGQTWDEFPRHFKKPACHNLATS